MANTPPALGYGQRGEASIDAVNQWMRSTPWYQSLLQSWGQGGANGVHLNDTQKQAVIRAAQANGVVVDEGGNGQEIDDSGNFHAKSHALRNTLIVAGIAAASIATMGAAGMFSGAAAGAEGAASAVGAGGAAAGAGAAAGGAGAAGAGAGTLGSLAAGGATAGLFSSPMLIPTLAGALGGVVSNIYSANKTASSNADAARLQTEAANHAADVQAEAAKYAADLQAGGSRDALNFTKDQAAIAQAQHEQASEANYNQWAARERRLGTLGQSIGLSAREIPAYVPLSYSGGSGSSGSSGSAPAEATTFLKGLLDKGTTPQDAIKQTNDKFNLKTGSEATYYDPSQHGGIATIGLPDAYLALTNGTWNVTQRGGGPAPVPAPTTVTTAPITTQPNARTLGELAQQRPLMAFTPPSLLPPGSLGSYMYGNS